MQPLDGTPIESNPWKDQLGELSLVPMKPTELHGPDLSAIDKSIYVSPEPAPATVPEPDRDANTEEVLNEFDPLSDRVEQAAREAWAHSESHPPPSQPIPVSESEESILDSASPEPPPKDIPPVRGQPPSDSPRTSGSNFPSLASFTRSFSIPTIGRPRPISIDVAKPPLLSSSKISRIFEFGARHKVRYVSRKAHQPLGRSRSVFAISGIEHAPSAGRPRTGRHLG